MASAMNNAARPAASRRRPHPATAPGGPSKASSPRRVDAGQPELPGPAALLSLLTGLWGQHSRLDEEAGIMRRAELPSQGERRAIEAERVRERITAMEALAIASAPVTMADAVAQLVLIHAEVSNRCDSNEDPEVALVPALLESAVYALVVMAKAADFNIASAARTYFRPAEAMIARGEVAA